MVLIVAECLDYWADNGVVMCYCRSRWVKRQLSVRILGVRPWRLIRARPWAMASRLATMAGLSATAGR